MLSFLYVLMLISLLITGMDMLDQKWGKRM